MKAAKIAAAIVGAVLVFVGVSIGVFGSGPGFSATDAVALGTWVVGVLLVDWGAGLTRRWREFKAKRSTPKYPPRGGGM